MSIMKSENKKSWLYYAAIAALVVAELYLLHFLYKYINLQLNSDDASELVLAHLLAKQKRITQAATLYLMQKNWLRKAVRFDLVEIHGFEVIHIPNAFQPYGKFQH